MKKYLFCVLCVILSSCQPSVNKKFEDAMKETTGKSVSYNKSMLESHRETNNSTDWYYYDIDMSDKEDMEVFRSFINLCAKVDDIMFDYNCTFSTYKVEKYNYLNYSQYSSKGQSEKFIPSNDIYTWRSDSLFVDVRMHLSSPKDIVVSINRKLK